MLAGLQVLIVSSTPRARSDLRQSTHYPGLRSPRHREKALRAVHPIPPNQRAGESITGIVTRTMQGPVAA